MIAICDGPGPSVWMQQNYAMFGSMICAIPTLRNWPHRGLPPKYVQLQLGHSSIQVTMDVYSHFFQKRSSGWVNKLDEQGEKPQGSQEQSATQAQPEEVVF